MDGRSGKVSSGLEETNDPCTFKWSDGRTVETIGAPAIIHHTDRVSGYWM
jgi:hypothetical protein